MLYFYMLTLYTAPLVNSLFLVAFCRFHKISTCMVMLTANKHRFYFILYFSLNALTRASSEILRSGSSRHPCLYPDIRAKTFNHLQFSIILTLKVS